MTAELWILFGTFVTGAGATAISWAGAVASGRREKEAQAAQQRAETARDKALGHAQVAAEAAERQAAAQEEANRLAMEARRPPNWSAPTRNGKILWSIRNSSGRRIEVLGAQVSPGQFAEWVSLDLEEDLPDSVAEEDSLRFRVIGTSAGRASLLILTCRFEGEKEEWEHRVNLD